MQSSKPNGYDRHILVLDSEEWGDIREVYRYLEILGAHASAVTSFEDASLLLREGRRDYGALLIPTSCDSDLLKKNLQELLVDAPPGGLSFVSVGPPPTRQERRRIRKAGVKLALWSPTNEAILRFQINRALNAQNNSLNKRENPRVPTQLRCLVQNADREKETRVYSLSASGAFLQTNRASMNGTDLELNLSLPNHPARLKASVVFSNVTGNLQKPGLPLGMAVHFGALEKDDRRALRKFVADSLAELMV